MEYRFLTHKGSNSQTLYRGHEMLKEVEGGLESSLDSRLVEVFRQRNERLPVLVGYDNTFVCPSPKGEFPIPSLMHFYLAETLRNEPQLNEKRQVIADLGCGAGFLGNFLLRNLEPESCDKMIFGDLWSVAINSAIYSYLITNNLKSDSFNDGAQRTQFGIKAFSKSFQVLDFRVGDVRQTLAGERANVTVACPTYVPGICEVFPQAYQMFGEISREVQSVFYFAHSSLADLIVEKSANAVGANLEVLDSRRFPFTVDHIDSSKTNDDLSPEKIDELVALGLQPDYTTDPVSYTHEIRVAKMSFSRVSNRTRTRKSDVRLICI